MSLDGLLQKTKKSRKVEENVCIFLPPEYEITLEQWRILIDEFNRTPRKAKVADAIMQYIRQNNPDRKDLNDLISIGEIVEKDGLFYTDLSFDNDKPGLTAMVIFKSEDLKLVPISAVKGEGGIRHVSLTYIPD
jgi:hypothetical protein